MKKMMLVAAACAVVASPQFLSADTVTSVNVVGYYTVSIPTNGLALVTPVLENMEGATIDNLVGDQMVPGKAKAFIWDRQANAYASSSYNLLGTWGAPGNTNILLRGDGIWLQNNDAAPVTITFMGEVPAEYNNAATTTVANITGVDAVGYSYPVDVMWTNTTLSADLPNTSKIFYWNVDSQSYTSSSKNILGDWDVNSDNLLIRAGSAFWVQTPSALDWLETAPYDL